MLYIRLTVCFYKNDNSASFAIMKKVVGEIMCPNDNENHPQTKIVFVISATICDEHEHCKYSGDSKCQNTKTEYLVWFSNGPTV